MEAYLVKWKGYDEAQNTWEPCANLENAQELVNAYHFTFPDAPGPAPTLAPTRRSQRRR